MNIQPQHLWPENKRLDEGSWSPSGSCAAWVIPGTAKRRRWDPPGREEITHRSTWPYTSPGPKTKLCPLVGSGILYMDHPKNHSLFGLGLPGHHVLEAHGISSFISFTVTYSLIFILIPDIEPFQNAMFPKKEAISLRRFAQQWRRGPSSWRVFKHACVMVSVGRASTRPRRIYATCSRWGGFLVGWHGQV